LVNESILSLQPIYVYRSVLYDLLKIDVACLDDVLIIINILNCNNLSNSQTLVLFG